MIELAAVLAVIALILFATWTVLRTSDEDAPHGCPQCHGYGFLEDRGCGWEPPAPLGCEVHDLATMKRCPGCW